MRGPGRGKKAMDQKIRGAPARTPGEDRGHLIEAVRFVVGGGKTEIAEVPKVDFCEGFREGKIAAGLGDEVPM